MNHLDLLKWCSIPVEQLSGHPGLRCRFRLESDSTSMGLTMARELTELIDANNRVGRPTRAIIPCGPACWYGPFTEIVNAAGLSLRLLHVFHMDECLDWQGQLLPERHPYNFRSFMETHFYGGIRSDLAVPASQRFWLFPAAVDQVRVAIAAAPIDITLGGWGQDGHVAYNQARRHPFSAVSLDQVASSTIRIQENNLDTILALAQRTFGAAYQFVPPMSITLGMRECLSAQKDSPVQRYRRVEADCVAGCALL